MPRESYIRQAHSHAVGGAPKRCSKGKNCSAACIERSDICLVEIPLSASGSLSPVRDKISEASLSKDRESENRSIKTGILGAIKDDNEQLYDSLRDRAIAYNKKLGEGGNAESLRIFVPIPYERVRKIKEVYLNETRKLVGDYERLMSKGDEKAAKVVERRLRSMDDKFASRLSLGRASDAIDKSKYEKAKLVLKKAMIKELSNNNLDKYLELKREYVKLQDKYHDKLFPGVKREAIPLIAIARELQYERVKDKLLDKMRKASQKGDRNLYDKLESRLINLQGKLGGEDENKYAKGEMWNVFKRGGALSPLRNAEEFDRTLGATDGRYNEEIRRINLHTLKALGLHDAEAHEASKYGEILRGIRDRIGSDGIIDGLRAVKKFTGVNYSEIRHYQRTGSDNKEAKDLERFINDPGMEKPKVVKFRGLTVDDDKLTSLLSEGVNREGATASWSTSLNVAAEFSNRGIDEWGDNRVILRAINSKGIAIDEISDHKGEYEILTSKDAKYVLLDYRVINYNGEDYHVFDLDES